MVKRGNPQAAEIGAAAMAGPGTRPTRPDQWIAVAELFSVLSEPTRLRILEGLRSGPATVTEILVRLQLGQANTSKQLGILYRAGLVSRTKAGNTVRYALASSLPAELTERAWRAVRDLTRSRIEFVGGAAAGPFNRQS